MVTFNQCRKDFIKALEKVSRRYHVMDVFSDVCALMACACERFSHAENEREERYQAIIEKYTESERKIFPQMFAMVVNALEDERKSFLGPVLEEIGAANTKNGQFLTPSSVAAVMAKILAESSVKAHMRGELVTINDPACGCGALIIEGAEALAAAGIPQKDIMIYCGDIDCRVLDATFVELTLLGYAARCDHMDALAMRRISRPRWTINYFMFGTQWREGLRNSNESKENETWQENESASRITEHQKLSQTSQEKNSQSKEQRLTGKLEQATFLL